MPVVVDASVAIKWIVPEGELDVEALAFRDAADDIQVPDLIFSELINTGWKKCRLGAVTREEIEGGIASIRQYFTIHSSSDLCDRALAIALTLDHPAYDCFYLACAEATQSVLVTADRRLCDVAARGGLGHLVRHLSDVPVP